MSEQKETQKFDPTKKYTWTKDTQFVINGGEFGMLLNALRTVTSTQEAQALYLAKEAAFIMENALKQAVENGSVIGVADPPSNSL